MWSFKTLAIMFVVGVFPAAGCGFEPLYRTDSKEKNVVKRFSLIQIAPIEERLGQQLRNLLRDKITPKGIPTDPVYKLVVILTETRNNLVILQDATSTFAKIRLKASFKLINISSEQSLIKGTATTIAVFNINESEYANIRSEAGAKTRAAEEISEAIRTRLALFLSATPR
jgi:LPS-assembly lipoprotein